MNMKKLTLLIALSILIVTTTTIFVLVVKAEGQTKEEVKTEPVETKPSVVNTTTTIPIITTTAATTTKPAAIPSVAQLVWDAMKKKDWSDDVCAGILGNMMAECGGGTLKLYPYANGDGNTSFGLCQWHKERKTQMLKFNNKNYNTKNNLPTIEHQIDFLEYELKKYRINILEDNKTYQEEAYIFCVEFERPSNKYQKAKKRQQLAAIAYQEFAI